MTAFHTLILDPLKGMLKEVIDFIPVVLSALLILVIGLLLAKLFHDVILRVLKEIRLDKMAERLGVSRVFSKSGIKYTLSEMLSLIIYWLFIVIFIMITVKAIGLSVVSDSLDRLLGYVPHVLSAVVVLVLGMILAKVVSGLVHFVASYLDLPKPKLLERISRWAVVISAATISIEELGFGSIMVGTTFYIIFGAVAFAFALAYGLGGKEIAAKHLGKYNHK